MEFSLDKTDRQILKILQEDSTISVKDIAARIGLTATPTYERIRRMEESGVIKKYVALVDRSRLGYDIVVYCNVVLREQSKKSLLEFESAVVRLPSVLEVISVSGSFDYMLKIVAKNVAEYNRFVVDEISNLPHMGQYQSSIVLDEVKMETALML